MENTSAKRGRPREGLDGARVRDYERVLLRVPPETATLLGGDFVDGGEDGGGARSLPLDGRVASQRLAGWGRFGSARHRDSRR